MRQHTKKIFRAFVFCVTVLCSAIVWGCIFDNHSIEDWNRKFEERLHKQEKKADNILERFVDSVDVKKHAGRRDVIFIGVENGRIDFWTNEIIGIEGLYDLLSSGMRFVSVNNSFYEVRSKVKKEKHYYAFLHIKDNYPYSNKYIHNHFGSYFKIRAENVENIAVSPEKIAGGRVIESIEGEELFYIKHNEDYKDRSINYILIVLYILFFLSLFNLFGLLFKYAPTLGMQSLYLVMFTLFLLVLHGIMFTYRLPEALYRLQIFDVNQGEAGIVGSIGDLLIVVLGVYLLLYICFANHKISYGRLKQKRRRYMLFVGLLLLIWGYLFAFTYMIKDLINNENIFLNIARIIDVNVVSIIVFLTIILAALCLITLIDGVVSIMKTIIRLKEIAGITVVLTLMLLAVQWIVGCEKVLIVGTLFLLLVFILLLWSSYQKKREIQRSIYLLILFFMSVYIVFAEEQYEREKEKQYRMALAEELISERDYNFEKKLIEIDRFIRESEVVRELALSYQEVALREYLKPVSFELSGYNYYADIILCNPDDILNIGEEDGLQVCHHFFDNLIDKSGIRLGDTKFYVIEHFDGVATYIGVYVYGDVYFIFHFSSTNEDEGKGYPQILSRQLTEDSSPSYPYSYAKYKNEVLIKSSGFFNYYKSLDHFGKMKNKVRYVDKNDYSHLFVPVDPNGMLVLSLSKKYFSIYYVNVLYVFFISILFSSYGMFFNVNTGIHFGKGTLKARIRNNILLLIFALFVIMLVFSIIFTTKSYEKRHYIKSIELLKYLNKELEQQDCVEYKECPEILDILANWSEVLEVDINIYSEQGHLVSTSRPEIYQLGLSGYLINPVAYNSILVEKNTSYVAFQTIGDMSFMSAYIPLQLEDDKLYVLNVPYFTENDDLNQNIFIMIIVVTNIVVIVIILAFILSGVIADRVTKPLQLINTKLKRMKLGGKNEKIDYSLRDEVGSLVMEYNNMVEKLDENVKQLSKTEREDAWREMAKQIAHEVKNPLTPMKLNIQYMQRLLQVSDPYEFKEKFRNISDILIKQIDTMASIASAFSDFAKISESKLTVFDLSELALSCVRLFENNVEELVYDIEPEILISADKGQIHRLIVNIIKNSVQSISEGKLGLIEIKVKQNRKKVEIRIKDNGCGIPDNIKDNIFEPNFTTKSQGSGLGLAISKKIVENAGGDISFKTSDEGTEFIIVLDIYDKG